MGWPVARTLANEAPHELYKGSHVFCKLSRWCTSSQPLRRSQETSGYLPAAMEVAYVTLPTSLGFA